MFWAALLLFTMDYASVVRGEFKYCSLFCEDSFKIEILKQILKLSCVCLFVLLAGNPPYIFWFIW